MIRIFYADEKTNSYRPEPWNWSTDPFPAFRGQGQRYSAFLAVANGFTPWFSSFDLADNTAMSDDYCKIITTKKGTRLLVPCSKSEDERIMLITARGGFRGGFGKIEAIGAEILWQNGMSMHCCPVQHIIARIIEPDGYIRTETGRRSSFGYTEIYSWKGGYFGMSTEEYCAAVDIGALFAVHDTIQRDLERCKAKHRECEASREAKGKFIAQLVDINSRLKACYKPCYTFYDDYFTEPGWSSMIYHRYTVKEVDKAEQKAVEAEREVALRRAKEVWKPQFLEAVEGYTFPEEKNFCGESSLIFYYECVGVRDHSERYEYSAEGLEQFIADIPTYEEEYQEKLRLRAIKEAKAKAEAEEEARLAQEKAEAEAKKAAAEAEAKALGLPSDIRLWHRTGVTNAGEAWVIGPDGRERECDFVDTMVCGSNSKKYHQSYEGNHVWNQIIPGELVLYWSHAYTAAPHEFEVIYAPDEITEAQLERVSEIQEEIERSWLGCKSASGKYTCPSIGQGWGLFHREESVSSDDEDDSASSGMKLGDLFGDVFVNLKA